MRKILLQCHLPTGSADTVVDALHLFSKAFIESFHGQIPSNGEQLMDLPGMSEKAVDIVMQEVFGQTTTLRLTNNSILFLLGAGLVGHPQELFSSSLAVDMLDVDQSCAFQSHSLLEGLLTWVPSEMHGTLQQNFGTGQFA